MNNVATPNEVCARMLERIKLPRTLMLGTDGMRDAGQFYLPREQAESEEAYRRRLERTVLFNAFKKTVQALSGKVFSKPITLGDDVPERLFEFAEDIDLQGHHLSVFARDIFEAALVDGQTFILVDSPRVEGSITLADERNLNIRPYAVHVLQDHLIGFKSVIENGVPALTQIRLFETAADEESEFDQRRVPQVRVINRDSFQLFRRTDAGVWFLHDEGEIKPSGMRFVAIQFGRVGFMESEPPLMDLAHLNAAHWRSSSDQSNILHVARVPILFSKGFDDDTTIEIGPNRMIAAGQNADLKFVEHSGRGIEAGRDDLADLEARMAVTGMELLVRRPGTRTATEKAIDTAEADSALAAMATALEDGLETMLGHMAAWIGMKESDGGSVAINKDFGISARAATDLELLLRARAVGDISRDTLLEAMRRRGVLPDDFSAADEAERLAAEPPGVE